MRRLEAKPLEGFNDTPVEQPAVFKVVLADGRSPSYDEVVGNTPAVSSSYDGYHDSQLVIGSEAHPPDWDDSVHFPVGRLDDFHGRNVEVLADCVVIEDKFSNEYRSLCIKGSDLSDPYFFKSATAERDYIINGLQESLVMERILRASGVLRRHGVSTEYICGLALPQTFPVDGEYQPLDVKAEKTLPEFLEHLATRFAAEAVEDDRTPLEIKTGMMERFQDCDYLVSYRAMDCPTRFEELSDKNKFNIFRAFVVENYEGPGLYDYVAQMQPATYIYHSFAPALATNVARMHKLGVTHGFLHTSNITALGSPIDLDSCRGEILGLGDEPVTEEKMLDDAYQSLSSIHNVMRAIPRDPQDRDRWTFLGDCEFYAVSRFVETYLRERFPDSEDRNSTLLALLAYTYYRNSRSTQQDARNTRLLVKNFTFTYGQLNPDVKAPALIPTEDTSFDPNDSFASFLPARLFQDRSDYLLSDQFADAKSLHDVETPQVPFNLGILLHSMAFDEIMSAYAGMDTVDAAQVPEVMASLSYMFREESMRNDDADPEVIKARQYFRSQLEKVVRGLSEPTPEALQPAIHPKLTELIQGGLSHLKNQLGRMVYRASGESITFDAVYLDDHADYAAVIKNLGINEDTPIEFRAADQKQDIVDMLCEDSSDVIMLLDYKMAEALATETNYHDVFVRVIGNGRPGLRPGIMITGAASGDLKVYVFHGSGAPEDADDISDRPLRCPYDKFMERYCTENPKEFFPRLF